GPLPRDRQRRAAARGRLTRAARGDWPCTPRGARPVPCHGTIERAHRTLGAWSTVNAVVVPADPIGPMSQAWRECVGTGRFNLALRSDYLESLALTQAEIGFRYIRGHGLLGDDIGVYRPYDDDGHRGVLHSFTYVDQVVDSYLSLGIKPFV